MEIGNASRSDYEILGEIPGYYRIYKAINNKTNMVVQLERYNIDYAGLREEFSIIIKDILNFMGFHHKTTLKYNNFFFECENLYLETEFCENRNISYIMKLLNRPLSELEVCAVMKSVVV